MREFPQTTKWLADESGLPERRFRFCACGEESLIATIARGIFFVLPYWSGPAHQAFKTITRSVHALDSGERLALVVMDLDGAADLANWSALEGIVKCEGLAAWIRAGKVEGVCAFAPNLDCREIYHFFTKALLNDEATL